ncbi:dUTPase-like protein [Coniella lustricola]|uniref:Deoxyuridine 5'-triphosphate nucleotidohydrolase n=1 Tax=Coniella lustricola TaxID=2025994 RepID=A0A2T3AH38_9PEZI|nr:dUTPase-like protein [Coniella lustricola]
MTTDNNDQTSPASHPAKRIKLESDAMTSPTPLLIKRLSEKARLPTRGSPFSAGYDIYASKATVVPARGKVLVDTDISMACPPGTYGRIAPRSGLASKHFIDTGAGVIDADYRGQVKILLFNHSEADFPITEGDRVAQLVLERIYTPEVLEVAELEDSARGTGGFGSTGGFGEKKVVATVTATDASAKSAPEVEIKIAATANGNGADKNQQQPSS